MRTIYKYPLALTDSPQIVEMPEKAIPIFVAAQCVDMGRAPAREQLTLWCEVPDNGAPNEPREIHVIGTGNPMQQRDDLLYLGSALMFNGTLVWHVFEAVAI